MSRTRIVKGNITKVIGGDYKRYSKDDIENIGSKVIQIGKENGVVYGEPEKFVPPPIDVQESEYKLESTYAHEQLMSLAKELGEITFMLFMTQIFGYEIDAEALSRLYRDLSDNKIKAPEIIVSKGLVGRRGGPAGYSNKRKKIIVNEKFVEEASKDNDKRAELMAALVEEYGHHIDNLLRTELTSNGIPDTDVIDEGAKFAYYLFRFDIFNESQLNFAKAELPTFKGDLIIDFSTLHSKVTAYVEEDRQYDEDPTDDISNYGAGRNRKHNKNAAFAHGDIEFEALVSKELYTEEQVRKIYFGNWLRDFSQVIVKITVRGTNAAIKAQKNKVIKEVSPMQLSHEGWVQLIKILAIREFVFDPLKDAGKNPADDYKTLEEKFNKEYGGLTKDILGIYRPEEHIDNPFGLADESDAKDDKGKVISFMYDGTGTEKKLYAGDNGQSWKIDATRNMSSFFWKDFPERPSSVTYVKEQLKLAVSKRGTPEGFRHLGGALHVLEDYFSHTNFVEISLRRLGVDAYPWVSYYKGKEYTGIPVVSGRFLTDDTMASVGPKMGDLLFDPKIKEYKRRVPGQRSLAEKFIISVLEDLSKGQKSDKAEKSSSYLGVEFATWLSWFNQFLKFQDFLAKEYQNADKKEWMSRDFFEKLGARSAENLQKGMGYTGQIMAFFPKLVFNLVLGSFDEVIPEAQSHLNTNYGVNPSHSQIAKDSYSHPLNKISAELAKMAIKEVTTRFKNGMDGSALADYTTKTYFVHPSSPNARWCDKYLNDWVARNPAITKDLKYGTIYDHAEHELQEMNTEAVKKIKEIMGYFEKMTK
ncbi:Het-C domain-containing protein [Chryseobacterium paludis]|uniref:Het-C domain-containing protein n=1 Tax=Chryseobacterium paludis TaxID=2956784 RepID=UPI0021C06EF1|nr:Het-C domain-containing protein [Chryseobacterium paludis]